MQRKPMTEQDDQLVMAHIAANDAMRAVMMQGQRIECASATDDAFDQEIDTRFLVLALRWLDEACKLAATLTDDPALHRAIKDFERRLPHARDMRNVYEHISLYIRGKGKLQKEGLMQSRAPTAWLGSHIWLGQDRKSTLVWADMELHVDEAQSVAEHLYSSLCDAVALCGLPVERVTLRAATSSPSR